MQGTQQNKINLRQTEKIFSVSLNEAIATQYCWWVGKNGWISHSKLVVCDIAFTFAIVMAQCVEPLYVNPDVL